MNRATRSIIILLLAALGPALPSVSSQDAAAFNGLFYWSNSSSGEFFTRWNASGLAPGRTEISYTYGTWRYAESDTSDSADVGIICHSDASGNPAAMVINTTTGAVISAADMGSGGTSSAQFCDVLFWKGSSDALLAYETGTTDSAFQLRTYSPAAGLSAAQAVTFATPANGNGNLDWFSVKGRPGSNEAAIGWHGGGGNDSVGFVVWDRAAGKRFNWTSNASFAPYTGSGNRFDLAWTADGSRLFVFFGNASSSTSATIHFVVYDRASNTVSNAFRIGAGGVIEDARLCTLRGRSDAVIYIAQSYAGSGRAVNVGVLLAGGAQEPGAPASETSTEGDTGEANINVNCFQEPGADGDAVLTFVDADALGVDAVTYDPDTATWSAGALTSAPFSGNFATDDIEMTALTPCPAQQDCFMLSTVDAASDLYTGAYWNGSAITTGRAARAESAAPSSGRTPFAFLFRNAAAAPGAPVISAVAVSSDKANNDSTANWTGTWTASDPNGDTVFNSTWYNSSTENLLLYLDFNVNGAVDLSPNTNNGVVVNATYNATGGLAGSGAYAFDGANDYILVNKSKLDLTNKKFTILAWIKPNATQQNYAKIFDDQADDETGQFVGIKLKFEHNGSRRIVCAIDNGPTEHQAYSAEAVPANAWSQVGCRFNGSDLFAVVNGSQRGSNTSAYLAVASNEDWCLGCWASNKSKQEYAGLIDDVQVFDYALSDNQLLSLYQGKAHILNHQETDDGEAWQFNVVGSDGTAYSAPGTARFWISGTAGADEASGRAAIDAGISASELTSPAIEADTVVYLVTLDGTHRLGSYDRFVSSGAKRWGFNYLAGSDAAQGLPDVLPSLYFWEYGGLSAQAIQAMVSGFVNGTN